MNHQQEDWQAIAASVRIALEKRIPDMAAMTPEELLTFVEALDKAETFELFAGIHEDRQQAAQSKYRQPWSE